MEGAVWGVRIPTCSRPHPLCSKSGKPQQARSRQGFARCLPGPHRGREGPRGRRQEGGSQCQAAQHPHWGHKDRNGVLDLQGRCVELLRQDLHMQDAVRCCVALLGVVFVLTPHCSGSGPSHGASMREACCFCSGPCSVRRCIARACACVSGASCARVRTCVPGVRCYVVRAVDHSVWRAQTHTHNTRPRNSCASTPRRVASVSPWNTAPSSARRKT